MKQLIFMIVGIYGSVAVSPFYVVAVYFFFPL
jgi:hypothetical protein